MATVALHGCGGGSAASGSATPKLDDTKPRVVMLPEQLYLLEATGIPPADTSVTFLSGQPRSLILRHGPPDNTVFVQFDFPANTFPVPKDSLAPRDSVTIAVRPYPGLYSLEVTSSVTPVKPGLITFKYPVHFAAPNAAIARYGTKSRYEKALMVGIRIDSTSIGMFESIRPASDNLRAAFLGSGTYLVAAPR